MTSYRLQAGRIAHLLKAIAQQHHTELGPVLRPYIPKDGVVVDVGAHAGQFSKLFARMVPGGRVYAFEPSPYARSILIPALAWNRLRNVEVVPIGLSDHESAMTLRTPITRRGEAGFGRANLGAAERAVPSLEDEVTLSTLDRFLEDRRIPRLDFIKADVEGWEAHVLRGAAGSLVKFRPALLLEVSDGHLRRAGSTPDQIWEQLKPLGYAARLAPKFDAVQGFSGDGDYLFTPT